MLRKNKRHALVAEINVVPYIDVMLVLLVIFMVTAPLLTQGVKVDLPQAPSLPIENKEEQPLIVSIKADGTYYINIGSDPKTQIELASVADKVGKLLRQKPATPVLIWGDEKVDYGAVVKLMTLLQGAGAASVGLVTETP